jgi:hypoxanthine-guanine phosphoribosyltransferase
MQRDPAIGEILVQPDELAVRVRQLGQQISEDYQGRDLVLVGVLKGAVFFLSDLMREITVPCEVDFMAVASDRRKVETPTRYIGFEIPDKFAIGYGLDHAERYRNLPYVAALDSPGT